jgi:hypothetical protein
MDIRIKRGQKDNLPSLGTGELAFTTDTNELYIGNSSSNVKLATGAPVDVTPLTVSSSVQAGVYNAAQSVVLTPSKAGTTIYYTTNNTTPTTSSTVYTAPITVSSTTTIQFFGKDSSGNTSSIQSVAITIDATAPTVSVSIPGGTYNVAQTVTLSSTKSGSTIYYTLDNSDPTVSGIVYSGSPLTISATTTLKFYARDSIGNIGAVQTVVYTIDATRPGVTITPNGGLYNGTQSVVLSSSKTGSTIYYTTNGDTPTTGSSVYTTPLSVTATETIKAFAVDTVGNAGVVQIATFTIDTVPPTVSNSASGGVYNTTQSAVLTSSKTGSTIYYTLDGSTPTATSTVYTSPISITSSVTLKYFAKDQAGNVSGIQTVTYTIATNSPVLTISEPGGTYNGAQTITLTVTDQVSATIYYTLDGSTPTTSSTVYTAPIVISSTSTLKYFALDIAGNDSGVQVATFTIGAPVSGVTLSSSIASIVESKTFRLTATVSPANAINQSVTWTSSNTAVATVDNTGLVTGVKPGTATITVTTVDGGKTATCNMTITQAIVGFDYNNLVTNPLGVLPDTFDQHIFFSQSSFPTSDQDWVHPSVLYFENGWNGHKWWMGINPYPATQSLYENPFIFYSDDGDNWITPTGEPTPIIPLNSPPPPVAGTSYGNNSDSHIFMDQDGVTMHYLNRACWSGTPGQNGVPTMWGANDTPSDIQMISSTDGVHWSAPVVVLSSLTNGGYDCLAPSYVFWNGKHYIFGIDELEQNKLYVWRSDTLTANSFQLVNKISTGTLGNLWHPEVRYINGEFIIVANTGGAQGGVLMLGKFLNPDTDTIMQGRSNAFVVAPSGSTPGISWDELIYKSSLIYINDDEIYVYCNFKGPALNGNTGWRVVKVRAVRLPQTLDLTGYQEWTSGAVATSGVSDFAHLVDHHKFVMDCTIDNLAAMPYFAGETTGGTSQYIKLQVISGASPMLQVVAQAPVGGVGGMYPTTISYGISPGDRITFVYDTDLDVYINGRSVYHIANVCDQYGVPTLMTNMGRRYGNGVGLGMTAQQVAAIPTSATLSNIKIYKKPQYFYDATGAVTYKQNAEADTTNLLMYDEFNRTSTGGVIDVSDSGWDYVVDGSIIGNQPMPTVGYQSNTALHFGSGYLVFPMTGNYQVLIGARDDYDWRILTKFTDINNYVGVSPNDSVTDNGGSRSTQIKVNGTNTTPSYASMGDFYKKHNNVRIDFIDGWYWWYQDNVFIGRLQEPSQGSTMINRLAIGGWYQNTDIDYLVIRQLPSSVPALRVTSSRTFQTTQTVTMSSSDTAGNIYYTLDNTTPTASSTRYTAPFTVSATTTVKAIAVSSGGSNTSPVSSQTYTLVSPMVNISDNFTRSNTTASLTGLGATPVGNLQWMPTAGTAATASGKINNNTGVFVGTWYVDSHYSDWIDVEFTAPTTTSGMCLIFRYQDDKNYWYFKRWSTSVELHYVNNGTDTNILNLSKSAATNETLKVTLRGGKIKCFLSGTQVLYWEDYFLINATKHGILAGSGTTINSFKVTAYLAPESTAPVVTAYPPNGAGIASPQNITLTSNEVANIYYTTDGSTPTSGSSVYGMPVSVTPPMSLKYYAVDVFGNASTVQTASYTLDATAPDPVTVLAATTASITTTNIPLTWTAPSATDVAQYEVAWSTDGGTTYTVANTVNITAPATGYTVTGLTSGVSGTQYTFRVVALDYAGNRSTPATVVATTKDTTAPTVSSSVAAGYYNSTQTVTLTSNEPATIYYTLDGSTPTTSSSQYSTPLTVSSSTTLKFFGKDTAGNSQTVQTVAITILSSPPDPVTLLAVGTPTSTTIPLTWTKPTSTYISKYEVSYQPNGGSFTVATNTLGSTSTAYTVTGLTPSTQYTLKVVAIDLAGNRSADATVVGNTTA